MKTPAFLRSFLVVPFLFCISQANASLVTVDWSGGSGVGWITRDTATELDWLDVTLSVNQTFDQVRTGIWYQRGFRHATRDELRTLFADGGTPDDNFNLTNTYPFETKSLAEMLGLTILVDGERESTYGFTGTDFFGNDINFTSHPIGVTFSALLGKLDYLSSLSTGVTGEAHFTQGHPFSNEADSSYGSFLVRTSVVPIPGAIWLFGSGLLGLVISTYRKK
jgi:hypothetical protein